MTDQDTPPSLAKRLVNCRHFRWLPGMLVRYGDGKAWYRLTDGDGFGMPFKHVPPNPRDAWPDLTDPATLGCLLALAREAWGNLRLVAIYCEAANPGQSEGWAVQVADNRLPVPGEDYATEAEALVAALEAAP